MIYAGEQYGPFEVFARSQSAQYFARAKRLFDTQKKDDLLPLVQAFRENKIEIPRWGFESFDPVALMGFDKLATLP